MDATQLLNDNLNPVLLGDSGDDLKRPIQHDWQNLTITPKDAATWPAHNNIGVRTGQQPDGRHLVVYDFDQDAAETFPQWLQQAQQLLGQALTAVVKTPGGGYHVYIFTTEPTSTRKLAFSDKLNENGRPIVRIETKGAGGQVVSAGSRHPDGGRYEFVTGSYATIPEITPAQYEQLDNLSRSFCLKPKPVVRQVQRQNNSSQAAGPGGIARDCLDYARRYIGNEAPKPEGQGIHKGTRFFGNGGLVVLANGRGWYCYGDDTGGGLVDLVVWNEGITRAEAIAKCYPPAANFSLTQTPDGYDIALNEGQFLGDVSPELPSRALLAANTGIGKTTYALSIDGRTILVVPTQALVEQLGSLHPEATAFYQFNRKITGDEKLIITTPNSIQKLLPKIDASQYNLVVDEAHEFAVAGYRQRAYDDLAMCLNGQWQNVILMTGTPFPLVWGGMELYEPFSVFSPQRKQTARLVRWQDEKGRGSKLKTAVSLIPPAHENKRIFIHLQNKKTQLDSLIFELKQKGYERGKTAVLNADTRTEPGQDSDHYLHLMENEQLPSQVQVVIATAVLSTGINVKQRFDQVHFLSTVSSIEAQQIVNRFRLAAPGIVYDYINKDATGAAESFNVRWLADKITQEATATAERLTGYLVDKSPEGVALIEHQRKAAQALLDARIIQFIPEDTNTQEPASYQPSPAGVTHEIFKRFKAAERTNPALYKNKLAAYGWHFLDDLQRIIIDQDTTGRAAFVAECAEERRKKLYVLAGDLLGDGYTATNEAMQDTSQLTSFYIRNAQLALVLHGDKASGRPGLVSNWQTAVDGVLAAEDSAQKRNRLLRQLKVQQDRKNPLTAQIYGLFTIGERLTPDIIAARLMGLCERNPIMATLARKRWEHDEPINSERAVRFIRDYFELKRGKLATDTGRENCYIFIDDCPHIGDGLRLDIWAGGAWDAVSLPSPMDCEGGCETTAYPPANGSETAVLVAAGGNEQNKPSPIYLNGAWIH